MCAFLCHALTVLAKNSECVFFIDNTPRRRPCQLVSMGTVAATQTWAAFATFFTFHWLLSAVNLSSNGFPLRPTQQTCHLTSKARKGEPSSTKKKLN